MQTYLSFLAEQAKEHKSTNNGSTSYFKEYKHNEPIDVASSKIEQKLKEVNPYSDVIRHNETNFTMVHPGGNLITLVDTDKSKHKVSTHYITSDPEVYGADFGKATPNGSILYEAIRTSYVVTNGKPFIRQKNREHVRNALLRLQAKFFNTPRARHSNTFNMGEDASEFNSELNEGYQERYIVNYTHQNKKTGKQIQSKLELSHAVNIAHAKLIADNIFRTRKLKNHKIGTVEKA